MFEGIFRRSVTIVDENGSVTTGKSVAKEKHSYDIAPDIWEHVTEITYQVMETESDLFSVGDEVVLASSKSSDHRKDTYIIVDGENKIASGDGTYVGVESVE